jgi:hypothetical protein
MAYSLRIQFGMPSGPGALCGKFRNTDETASTEIWGSSEFYSKGGGGSML